MLVDRFELMLFCLLLYFVPDKAVHLALGANLKKIFVLVGLFELVMTLDAGIHHGFLELFLAVATLVRLVSLVIVKSRNVFHFTKSFSVLMVVTKNLLVAILVFRS